ncbi:MAG: RluA family pseudouridine synthase [Robiginitomaculum sp.]|nr:RluA family pseudouridine synthase [Robiginitomaculum sp.]
MTDTSMTDTPIETKQNVASEDDAGKRLDKWLAEWADLSRSRIKALILDGQVLAGGTPAVKPTTKIVGDVLYEITVPAPVAADPQPENIPLDIVYEDAPCMWVNKPVGLTVHPAVGNWSGTLVNALLHHCGDSLSGIGGVLRPGIVHRIDKNTTGLLVVAKDDKTHQGLSRQFAKHTVERVYVCMTRGAPNPRAGRIETRLARSPHDRKKMGVVKKQDARSIAYMQRMGKEPPGKIAITNYEFIKGYGRMKGASLSTPLVSIIECRLETGRTHQIRVHMAHIACPILGDSTYGKTGAFKTANSEAELILRAGLDGFDRQALHAKTLGFIHPITGEEMSFDSDLPDDMQKLEAALQAL